MPKDPRVVRLMREYKAALLRREADQMREMGARWVLFERQLDREMQGLAEEIARTATAGTTMTARQIERLDRYQRLKAQTMRQVQGYQAWADSYVARGQTEMLDLGARQAADAIQAAGVRGGFNRINASALEFMVGLCRDGSPLFDVLKKRALSPDAVHGLTDELVKATGLGWNPRKTATAMKDGLAQGLDKALQIARTEQFRAYRFASDEEYRASGVVVSKRRLAAKDGRTCAACLAQDGDVIPLGTDMFDHPEGRCLGVPDIG